MKNIFKYIISILIFVPVIAFSQENNIAKDSLNKKEKLKFSSLKIAFNLQTASDLIFKPERNSYAGLVELSFNNLYSGVLEFGVSSINKENASYSYKSSGYYSSLGLDYNMLKREGNDFFGVGLRFAMANYTYSANNINIEYSHYENFSTDFESPNNIAVWTEFVIGIKAEIFKNLYLGWSARVKMNLYRSEPAAFSSYDIPGYGKSENTFKLGAAYHIYLNFGN
ncbi:MAG: DUF6048 family protein [Bacteroidales bacterium]|jgi:hypothetical protein|nr:DUF6048 family protein [Bacteroidales bacterium]